MRVKNFGCPLWKACPQCQLSKFQIGCKYIKLEFYLTLHKKIKITMLKPRIMSKSNSERICSQKANFLLSNGSSRTCEEEFKRMCGVRRCSSPPPSDERVRPRPLTRGHRNVGVEGFLSIISLFFDSFTIIFTKFLNFIQQIDKNKGKLISRENPRGNPQKTNIFCRFLGLIRIPCNKRSH